MRQRSLREEVGSAINTSDLEGRDETLLIALAWGADKLGALLWRVKYGGDQRPVVMAQLKDALLARLHQNTRRIPGPQMLMLVEHSLREWLDDKCETCRGRKFVGTEYGEADTVNERCPAGCTRRPDGVYGLVRPFESASERMLNAICCQSCMGNGVVRKQSVDQSRTRVCPGCNGKGTRRWNPDKLADLMGISLIEFERKWIGRYDRCRDILRGVDRRAGMTIANTMRSVKDYGAPGVERPPL